jgi:hypothetical protein
MPGRTHAKVVLHTRWSITGVVSSERLWAAPLPLRAGPPGIARTETVETEYACCTKSNEARVYGLRTDQAAFHTVGSSHLPRLRCGLKPPDPYG